MTKTFRLLFGLLLAMPAMTHALGLGDIHLASALNQPLRADIELVGATAEELTQLRASLASAEAFTRNGIDRPQFLTGLSFGVAKDANGRGVLQVRSTHAMTEPFVTFLVEVTWPRGHLIREYTVLLDPPVFETKETPAPAIAAPRTGESTSAATGSVERSPAAAPTPRIAPAAASSAAAAAAAAGGEYRVVANDSLSAIGRRSGAAGAADLNRFMVATFRANPAAFDGNINRLRKGAVLRIPGAEDWQGLNSGEAAREVGRQTSAWRSAAATRAASGEEARLRLVPPSEPGTGAGSTGAPAAPGDAQRVTALEKELAETKRLLAISNDQLAQLQRAAKAAPPPVAAKPEAVPAPVVPVAPPPVAKPAEPAAAVAPPPPPAAEPPAAAPPEPKPATAAAPAPPPAPAPTRGILDTLGDNLLYVILGGAAVLLAALVGYNFLRRRREEADFDQVLQPADDEPRSPAPAPVTTIRGGARAETGRDAIVVEESDDDSGEYIAPPVRTAIRPAPVPVAPSIDDTLSSETALNLEQADPLAEADFHMAYGLYDQAADIVKLAINREPARRDLRLKLLEVYFVWGNKDSFLDVARELGRTRDAAPSGEWDKVVIMGRQIAVDDPLFAGAVGPAADVDLDLDAGGPQGVDLELLGDPTGSHKAHAAREAVDLDLGHALKGSDSGADTGPNRALDPDRLDLVLEGHAEDTSGATTREMRPRVEAPTVEQPALRQTVAREAPTVEQPALRQTVAREAPTVEQPALRQTVARDAATVESPALAGQGDQTIREKLDMALRRDRGSPADATAELSLDDLSFEIDKLSTSSTSLDSLAVTDHPSDAPTMVAGLDAKSRSLLETAARRAPDLEPTRESPRAPAGPIADDATALLPTGEDTDLGLGHAETATTHAVGGDLDLDLDELARALESDTVEQPRREELKFSTDVFQTGLYKAPNGLDVDVGAPLKEHREPTVTERIGPDDMPLPELEPVTLSEVGTKLDLARAYMDMGDPDGARSILQEVLSEGSASQKQEAQRLIESLPG